MGGTAQGTEGPKHSLLLARQGSILFAFQVFNYSIRIVPSLFVARMLGPEFFGNFSLAFALAALVVFAATMGLDGMLVKFLPRYLLKHTGKYNYMIRSAVRKGFLVAAVIAAVSFVFADRIIALLDFDPGLSPFLKTAFVLMPFMTLQQILKGAFQGTKKTPLYFAVDNVFIPLYYLCVVVLIYFFKQDYFLVLLARGSSIVIAAVILSVVAARTLLFPEKAEKPCKEELAEITKFSMAVLFLGSAGFLTQRIDQVMLGSLSTSFEVGLYAASMKISIFILFWLQIINHIIPAFFAELKEKEDSGAIKYLLQKSTKWVFCCSAMTCSFIIMSRAFLLQLFGNTYAAASDILLVLCAASLIESSTGSVGNVLKMTGFHKAQMVNRTLLLVLNIVLNMFLIPRYGGLGAAVATLISVVVINILRLGQIYAYLRFQPFSAKSVFTVLIAGTGVVAGMFLVRVLTFHLAVNIAVCAGFQVIVTAAAVRAVWEPGDKDLLKEVFRIFRKEKVLHQYE